MRLFTELNLAEPVLQAVVDKGYEIPSEVQGLCIPPLLEGKDVLGVAQTGTGKTAAFALPLLSRLDCASRKTQILCLAPTRELAQQVAEAFEGYGEKLEELSVICLYGGSPYEKQIRALRKGVQVVVGTPGRVMDHLRKGTLKLDALEVAVLDEADEMLKMGFAEDVDWIMEQVGGEVQSALFSATMPTAVRKIAAKHLSDPVEIKVKAKTETATNVDQSVLLLRGYREKLGALRKVLKFVPSDGVIVFARTKQATGELTEALQKEGYLAEALNGDVAQNQREKVVNRMKRGGLKVLVATDVAARGLDIDRISLVINYDAPFDLDSYVHRIGRTGRAGRSGRAILFLTNKERRLLGAIERFTKVKLKDFEFPSVQELNDQKLEDLFVRLDEEMGRDLRQYVSVVRKYAQRVEAEGRDVDLEQVAAAWGSLAAGGQPFYVHEDEVKSSGNAGEVWQGEAKAFDTYQLAVGEVHGISKKDVVGALVNEGGLPSQAVGRILVCKSVTLVGLPDNLDAKALKRLQQVKIKGEDIGIAMLEKGEAALGARPKRGGGGGRGSGGRGGGKSFEKRRGGEKPWEKKSRGGRGDGGDWKDRQDGPRGGGKKRPFRAKKKWGKKKEK